MPEKTIINLLESENARRFKEGQIIHLAELHKAKDYIENLIRLSKQNDSDVYAHRAITILGSRGSGKTSFLLNLEETYNDRKEVKVLPIIDPTLIEEKGHAFLNVVSAVSDLVTEHFNKNKFHSDSNDDTKRQWKDKLMKLAGGIPSIDGIGSHNSDHWMDAEFVMETGLATVSAARNLKYFFDEFLKESAKILQTEIFLLRFDDIDVDSSKGWAVLECIRKYFTSPKLIILLSGDINLYSTVVRQKKWLNFGKEILKYEGRDTLNRNTEFDTSGKFRDLVVDLSSQYMLKIMPPKYRIHLTTISEKKRITGDLNIYIQSSSNHQAQEIEPYYNKILAKFGIVNPTQQEAYRTFLLSLPLRTQIQFLTNSFVQTKSIDYPTIREYANDEILDIFISELEEKNVNTYIVKYSSKFINSVILELLISSGRLNDVYQLQPVTTDNSLNASLFSLNIVLAASVNNRNQGKYLLFDYFLKVAYPRNLLHIIPFRKISDFKENNLHPSIEDFCKKSGIFTDRVLRDIAGEMQSYIFGVVNNGNNQYTNYFIKLSGLQQKAKRNLNNRLDAVFSKSNDSSLVQKTLGYIPGFITTDSGQKTNLSYSIHLLFATIGELLKRDELIVGGQSREERLIELKSALLNLSQLRAYNSFNYNSDDSRQDKNAPENEGSIDTEDYINDYLDNSDWNLFSNILLDWFTSQKITMENPVPTHIMGKIFTRFFYALQNIDRNFTKNILLGELFNYQIIAFFNAVIIEDTLEQLRNKPQLNMDNTNLSNRIFKNNLNKLNRQPLNTSSLTLSRWLLSCPLLLCYIDRNDSELNDALNDFIGIDIQDAFRFSVYEKLNKIEILNSVVKNEDETYPVYLDGNPSLLRKGREKELITILKSTYPKFWFEENDLGMNRLHNEYIKRYLGTIFGNDDKSATKIRKIRKFLIENPSAWR